jgi:hypothetical protein
MATAARRAWWRSAASWSMESGSVMRRWRKSSAAERARGRSEAKSGASVSGAVSASVSGAAGVRVASMARLRWGGRWAGAEDARGLRMYRSRSLLCAIRARYGEVGKRRKPRRTRELRAE